MNSPTLLDFAPDPPTAVPAGYTLWFRADAPRLAWERARQAETEFACVNAIGCGQRRGGKWIVLPSGREPWDGRAVGAPKSTPRPP